MRDIEEMLTLDERSGADFILSLRKQWAATVYPAFINEHQSSGVQVKTPYEGLRELLDAPRYDGVRDVMDILQGLKPRPVE